MWDGKDGASVHAALLGFAAEGEGAGVTAAKKLEAGEAAWWLGVQHARAGRSDSALAAWRRAIALRGEFDEGFALIDELFRRGGGANVDEAYRVAETFAAQAPSGMPTRVPEAQARLAWALELRGHADSALTAVRPWSDALRRKSAWTRRLATIELAAGDSVSAWRSLTQLSARTRQREAAVESLVVRTQRTLSYSDERRQITMDLLLSATAEGERRFVSSLSARPETLKAKDGFVVRWFRVPAAAPARTPVLFVLAPEDSLVAADSLTAALAAAGHPVVLLAPRGSYGAFGPGVYGPEAWAGRTEAFVSTEAEDAARVMDLLVQRHAVPAGGWIVGAAGECAPVPLALARARHDVRALLLVAPRLPVVEVAEYRARLRAAGTRTFVQVAPEEPSAMELADLLARQTAPGQVRVADSNDRGHGVAIFRADAKVAQRFFAWLEEQPKK